MNEEKELVLCEHCNKEIFVFVHRTEVKDEYFNTLEIKYICNNCHQINYKEIKELNENF